MTPPEMNSKFDQARLGSLSAMPLRRKSIASSSQGNVEGVTRRQRIELASTGSALPLTGLRRRCYRSRCGVVPETTTGDGSNKDRRIAFRNYLDTSTFAGADFFTMSRLNWD